MVFRPCKLCSCSLCGFLEVCEGLCMISEPGKHRKIERLNGEEKIFLRQLKASSLKKNCHQWRRKKRKEHSAQKIFSRPEKRILYGNGKEKHSSSKQVLLFSSKSKAQLVHLGLKRFGGYARYADMACSRGHSRNSCL